MYSLPLTGLECSKSIPDSGTANRRSLRARLPHLHIPVSFRRSTLPLISNAVSPVTPCPQSSSASDNHGVNGSLAKGEDVNQHGGQAPMLRLPSLLSQNSFHIDWDSANVDSRTPRSWIPSLPMPGPSQPLRLGILPDVDGDEISVIELPPSAFMMMSSRMSMGQNGACAFQKQMSEQVSMPHLAPYSMAAAMRRYSVDEYYLDLHNRSRNSAAIPSSFESVQILEDVGSVEPESPPCPELDIDCGIWHQTHYEERVSHYYKLLIFPLGTDSLI